MLTRRRGARSGLRTHTTRLGGGRAGEGAALRCAPSHTRTHARARLCVCVPPPPPHDRIVIVGARGSPLGIPSPPCCFRARSTAQMLHLARSHRLHLAVCDCYSSSKSLAMDESPPLPRERTSLFLSLPPGLRRGGLAEEEGPLTGPNYPLSAVARGKRERERMLDGSSAGSRDACFFSSCVCVCVSLCVRQVV